MKAALLLALGACSFPRSSDNLACVTTDDCSGGRVCTDGFCVIGNGDAAPSDSQFACEAWPQPAHFDPCAIPPPIGALDLTTGIYTFHTDTGVLDDPAGGTIAVATADATTGKLISVEKLTIGDGATLRVIGDKPLVVASWTDIEIRGTIDASSTATELGAGANPTDCAAHAPTSGTNANAGGGGGGGGGFRGVGGNGGNGSGGAGQRGTGGTVIAEPKLHGGCAGAKGSTGNNNNVGGDGGAGGGAFQLTAQGAVTISGTLTAGGAGGRSGTQADNGGGGGGGGSGGMIGIEAAAITIEDGAIVAANGGGGGEGGDDLPGAPGADGAASATAAPGGSINNDDGANGGKGSAGAVVDGEAAKNDGGDGGGGGGGGGGAGYLTLRSPAPATIGTTAILSPTP
jgi:hypothetical protein